jgi:RHS repeat-associated protein
VSNYYPFGSLISDISRSSEQYRYGYNGKENDDEISGKNAITDYGARTYMNRLGKFMSTDPLKSKFPNQSSYIYAGNNPILYIDLDGKEQRPASFYQGRVIMAQDQMPNPAFDPNSGNLNSRDGSRPFGDAGITGIAVGAGTFIVARSSGKLLSKVPKKVYIGLGKALFEEYTGIPADIGLKSMFKKRKVGGAFGDILTKKGFHRHHMPAKSASPLKAKDGPAIRMKIKDHMKTASFRSGKKPNAYRKKQKDLINEGKFKDAFEMDVQDVKSQFGNKYNRAIKQAKKQMIKVEKRANGGKK